MKKKLNYCSTFLVMLLVISFFSSCRKEPHFDKIPHISFKSFKLYDGEDLLGNKTKNLDIVLYFQDGDGNLGLSTTLNADNIGNFHRDSLYHDNFFAKLLVEQTQPDGTTEFVEYEFPNSGFDLRGRFPRISTDVRPEPLEGEIKFTKEFVIDIWQLVAGKVVKFEIYVLDRDLNKSNVIITPELALLR